MDFWNSLLTEKSRALLQELRKKYNFILIGGWAIYLWTKQHKSKDIDIVVSIGELQKLKSEKLSKNDSLKKYEIKFEEIDVDIYVEHFSELAIPANEIGKYAVEVEGFKVICPEALLILKQAAELQRHGSVKGEKDAIDIMSLLIYAKIDFKKYKSIAKSLLLEKYVDELIVLIRNFREYQYLSLTPRELKKKKDLLLKELRKL